MNGGETVSAWMVARGIDHFFTVPGESFLSVLDAIGRESRIRLITNRHEAGAAFAAEGYAKVTRRPAVAMATRGPGAGNLTIAVQTAHYDATPMIVLVATTPRGLQDSGAFQAFEPAELFGSVAKAVQSVRTEGSLVAHLDQAYATATTGRPGPVVVALPSEILEAEVPAESAPGGRVLREDAGVDATQLIVYLESAEQPAVLLATDARRASVAADIAALTTATGLPVFCAWRRFSAFSADHPSFVGSVGFGASRDVAAALADVDLVLVLGFGIEEVTAKSANFDRPGLTVVQVAPAHDTARARHAGRADVVEVIASPAVAAHSLAEWVRAHPRRARALRERHGGRTAALVATTTSGNPMASDAPLQARTMDALDRVLPENAIVASDAGNFCHWLLRYVRFGGDRIYIGPVNGAMGYGLPAAIGATLALPGRTAWCVAGDGGMMMSLGELETAVRVGSDIVAVVVDNQGYGTIRARQAAEYAGRTPGTDLGPVGFAEIARAIGWHAWTVDESSDLDAVLHEARTTEGCRLLHVPVKVEPMSLN